MKYLPMLAVFVGVASGQYAGPKTVYILPMSAGLDQYIAQSLTAAHAMQVVADPKAADVVMTDRLGEPFEQKMKQLRPEADDAKKQENSTVHNTFRTSKPRGTIFLVDAKSRQVLWSEYQKPPRSNSDRDLNLAAEQIVRKISGK